MDALFRFAHWLRVHDWRGSMRIATPRPFVGIALMACAGILVGEYANRYFARGPADVWPAGPWVACAVFFALAALFAWCPRRLFCWAVVMMGFTVLHLFRLADPASTGLVTELSSASTANDPESEDDPETGEIPESARPAAQTLRARGIILDEPRSSAPTGGSVKAAGGRNWIFTFGLSFVEVHGRAWRCRARVRVFWRNGPENLAAGERLQLTGSGTRIPPARNPGEFDVAGFLRRHDIRTELHCSGISDVQRLPAASGSWWTGLPTLSRRFQSGVLARLTLDLEDDPEAAAVVSTMLLGLRSEPGLGDLEGPFQRTGTLHYFAIDGLKLGLFTLLLVRSLALCGMRRQWSGTLILPILFFYALATGLGPASLRAVIVALVLAGGEWIGRPARPLNSLGAAAALIMIFDTNQLFELGFQLTFLIVLSILSLGAPLYRGLIRLGAPDPFLPQLLFSPGLRAFEWTRHQLIGLVCVSGAASLGSLPLMLIYFHVVSPISLLANVVMFPLVFGIIALGVMSLAVSVVCQTWAIWLNNGNWLLAKAVLAAVRCFDAVPGGSFYAALPEWRWERPAAEITVLDLPFGARSIHLRALGGAGDWLIDTGRPSDYQRIILPFLHSRGSSALDGLVLSQPDSVHLAAAPLVLSDLAPRRMFDSGTTGQSIYFREFTQFLAQRKLSINHWQRGEVLPISEGAEVRVLYPTDRPAGRAAGDKALVLQLRVAGWRVLFLGDSGANTAQWLAQHETPDVLHSDVLVTGLPSGNLQVAHDFLREISPRLIVEESPKENSRIGPKPFYARSPVPVISATKSGAITLRLYSHKIEVTGFVDGRSLKLGQ